MMPSRTIHGSAVQVEGRGVLIRGPSGSGKSSLVLALLLAGGEPGRLIADDRVVLGTEDGRLIASAPEALYGLLEVRGQGILRQTPVAKAQIDLVVDLAPPEACLRMPPPEDAVTAIDGVVLRRLRLPIGQVDGWLRVRAALLFPAADV